MHMGAHKAFGSHMEQSQFFKEMVMASYPGVEDSL